MAISTDLRRRAVEAYERGEGSIPTVAARFAVGEASLGRWLRRKRETGSVERAPRSGGNPRRVTPEGEALLRTWLDDDPSVAQHVLADRLAAAGHARVSQQTVGQTLARMALTLKKNRSEPSNDSDPTS
ncbi:MAG: helix-turn-helix domain-containing protein [Bacteroidota bacterium]